MAKFFGADEEIRPAWLEKLRAADYRFDRIAPRDRDLVRAALHARGIELLTEPRRPEPRR